MYCSNKFLDYVFYPYVLYRMGFLAGSIVMTVLSAIASLLLLKCYDWSNTDWLGLEMIRDLKNSKGRGRLRRFISWFLRSNNVLAFVFLSLYYDPFVTTVWLRHKRYGGMTARDHRIFWASVLVCNLFWSLSCWLGINFLEWVWR